MASRSKSPKQPTPKQEAVNDNTSQARLRELAGVSTELARIVAKNSNADPDLLRELGSSSDESTRKGVTANPNTPSDVLLKLGAQFPGQLLDNPVFGLLILENPNLLADMPVASLRSLLKRDVVPEGFLEWAVGSSDEGVLLAVAMNPTTPKSALEKLTQSRNTEVIEAAKLHVNWAGEMTEGWDEAAKAAIKTTNLERNCDKEAKLWGVGAIADVFLPLLSKNIRLSLAQNYYTPVSLLKQLAEDEDEEVRWFVAQNYNTPAIALEQLVEDENKYVREAAAIANPNTPRSIVERLELLKNPETPQDRLAELATSQCLVIREGVALHFNTPTRIIEQLAKDKSSAVRLAVAQNLNAPGNILEQLVKDKNKEVAIATAANPNTPVSILEELAQKKTRNKELQKAAVKNIFSRYPDKAVALLEGYLKSFKPSFTRLLVFLNPLAPSSFLAKNFRSSSWLERYAIAQNPNTPSHTLKFLATDGNRIVRAAASANLQQRNQV